MKRIMLFFQTVGIIATLCGLSFFAWWIIKPSDKNELTTPTYLSTPITNEDQKNKQKPPELISQPILSEGKQKENVSSVLKIECGNYEQLRFKCEHANQQVDYAICDDSELKKAECAFEEAYNAANARQPDEDSKKVLFESYKKFWNELGSNCGLSNIKGKPPSTFLENKGQDCILQAFKYDIKYFNESYTYPSEIVSSNNNQDATLPNPDSLLIEIRGLRVGMTEKELTEKLHSLGIKSWNNFMIANDVGGINKDVSEYSIHKDTNPVKLELRDGKLDKFTFYFKSSDFKKVRKLYEAKYAIDPASWCEDSTLSNYNGNLFEQHECTISGDNADLMLTTYDSNFSMWEGSSLIMTSRRTVDEKIQKGVAGL